MTVAVREPTERERVPSMRGLSPTTTATTVGVVTAIIGAALIVHPARIGPMIGLESASDARAVGALDLALSPGLTVGRPRWPWVAARLLANLLTAALGLQRSRGTAAMGPARRAAVGLGVATVADSIVLRSMLADR